MPSMRKLNRRLLRWQRYADRVAFNPRIVQPWAWQPPPGYRRAAKARVVERDRRQCFRFYPVDHGCCTLGEPGHDGPCVWFCSWCSGDGRCPECEGWDDSGCDECGGSLSCPWCSGQGEFIDDNYIGPRVETTTAFEQAGLL